MTGKWPFREVVRHRALAKDGPGFALLKGQTNLAGLVEYIARNTWTHDPVVGSHRSGWVPSLSAGGYPSYVSRGALATNRSDNLSRMKSLRTLHTGSDDERRDQDGPDKKHRDDYPT